MNVLTITGNLGKDAALREAGGTDVSNFSVAVKSGYGDREQTIWVDCAFWGKRGAAVNQYLTKGKQVTVSGEMGTREYEGKTYITMRVDHLTLGQRGSDSDNAQPAPSEPAAQPAQQPASGSFDNFDDDIPF